ncbi:GAF domain-containing protein [Aliikangiella sp. G2MR2-5]|uniref:GAF domain-containing protein n=1 Tax=Aliikangiella sp. G2MR2-5 TaxID=2788943 RepID=UPI0018AB468D|nr:GAF domain-containing protein [Aliikangiella sp. G2MR2-5]
MKFKSIRRKLIQSVTGILVVSFIIMIAVVAYMNTVDSRENLKKSEESIRNSLIAKGKTLANNNSQALKGMVEDNAFTAVQKLVSSTVRDDEDIDYGIFMDPDMMPWVSASADNQEGDVAPGESLEDEASQWASQIESLDYKIFSQNGDQIYEFASPVIVDDEILGFIRYGMSTNSMRKSLERATESSRIALRNTLLILLGAVILTISAGLLSIRKVAKTITRPLVSLQSAAGTIAGGNYDNEVTVQSNDEVGVLAENFDQMRATIKKKMSDLAKLNTTGEILATLLDQSKALEVVLKTMHEQIQVNHGSVYLMNDSDELEVKAFFPPKLVTDSSSAKKFATGEGVLGRAAKDKEVIFVPNTAEDSSFESGSSNRSPKALLCVPLLDKDILIGVMNLSGEVDAVSFEESDKEFVSSIARLLVITIKNIRMREVIEEQNRTLEQKVEERTSELREKTNDISNMLTNMHQGLFTVMEGGMVHHEYAAYLEEILETNKVANRNFMDLLFSNANIGSDQRNQIQTAVDALVGSDEMMFDFNSHLLATEIVYSVENDRSKILELDWDPIVLDGEIDKIMVTVRDVTEVKALQKEAEAQKKELEIIGQILHVGEEKMAEFFRSSAEFIQECKELIESTTKKDLDLIATLFRNMHTVKGNARTFGLNHITDSVHEVESTYDELRKNEEKVWAPEILLEELAKAESDIEVYRNIAVDKLEYDLEGGSSTLDPKVVKRMLDKIRAVKNIELPGEVKDVIDETQKLLLSAEGKCVSEVIVSVVDSVNSLADELGKSRPDISIADGRILVKKEHHSMMNNIFMHVFRNAIDHGIEKDEERQEKGKNIPGKISLACEDDNGAAKLQVNDDGRGLAISRLKEKAIEKGIYSAEEQPSDEEVANLIFASGFSTAEKVTAVSGRGVGMDAVKKFLEQNGGDIRIELIDNNQGADFRAFQTVIRLPESFIFQM